MRGLALAVVVVSALMSPTIASAQYTFGDWASDQGYSPGDIMPSNVHADWDWQGSLPKITSIEGIGEFDWTTTPTVELDLHSNRISSIESGDFSGLTNLTKLGLGSNRALTELNLDGVVNGLDVNPFVEVLLNGPYQSEADNPIQISTGFAAYSVIQRMADGTIGLAYEPATASGASYGGVRFYSFGVEHLERAWYDDSAAVPDDESQVAW